MKIFLENGGLSYFLSSSISKFSRLLTFCLEFGSFFLQFLGRSWSERERGRVWGYNHVWLQTGGTTDLPATWRLNYTALTNSPLLLLLLSVTVSPLARSHGDALTSWLMYRSSGRPLPPVPEEKAGPHRGSGLRPPLLLLLHRPSGQAAPGLSRHWASSQGRGSGPSLPSRRGVVASQMWEFDCLIKHWRYRDILETTD